MLEFDIDRDAANDGYGVDILHTLSIGHKIWGMSPATSSISGSRPCARATVTARPEASLLYGIGENMEVDLSFQAGISRRAGDFRWRRGWRFGSDCLSIHRIEFLQQAGHRHLEGWVNCFGGDWRAVAGQTAACA